MNPSGNRVPPVLLLMPVLGAGVFLGLFGWAASVYPGGSQADPQATGFSWMHNYWCNLLNQTAINGQPNGARPVAITATVVLCLSLSVFWYYLPILFVGLPRTGRLVRWAGISTMGMTLFIFTNYHDLITALASLGGLVTLAGTFWGLYRGRLINLVRIGGGCLLLIALNNYIYYTHNGLYFLPVIQKITLGFLLVWMAALTRAVCVRQCSCFLS